MDVLFDAGTQRTVATCDNTVMTARGDVFTRSPGHPVHGQQDGGSTTMCPDGRLPLSTLTRRRPSADPRAEAPSPVRRSGRARRAAGPYCRSACGDRTQGQGGPRTQRPGLGPPSASTLPDTGGGRHAAGPAGGGPSATAGKGRPHGRKDGAGPPGHGAGPPGHGAEPPGHDAGPPGYAEADVPASGGRLGRPLNPERWSTAAR